MVTQKNRVKCVIISNQHQVLIFIDVVYIHVFVLSYNRRPIIVIKSEEKDSQHSQQKEKVSNILVNIYHQAIISWFIVATNAIRMLLDSGIHIGGVKFIIKRDDTKRYIV